MTAEWENAFIPDQLFTTFIIEGGFKGIQGLDQEITYLGFMSPAGTDAAAKKRYSTQMDWAYYSYRSDYRYQINKETGEYLFYNRHTNEQVELPEELKPKTFDNEVLFGFRIAKSVRRYYWGGGNVVWRIEDPRGFELEITSSNMAKIMIECQVDHGVIQGKCVWARMGTQNLLVPVETEMYKEIVKRTQQRKNVGTLSLKDIKIGNVVEVYKHEGHFKYYGPLNVVYSYENNEYVQLDETSSQDIYGGRNRQYLTTKIQIANFQNKRYVFINENTNQLILLSTPKIVNKRSEDTISKQEAIKEINSKLYTLNYDVGYNSSISFVSEKPIELKHFEIAFIPAEDTTIKNYFDADYNYYDENLMKKFPLLKHYMNKELHLSVVSKPINQYTKCNCLENEDISESQDIKKYELVVNYNNQLIKQNINFL